MSDQPVQRAVSAPVVGVNVLDRQRASAAALALGVRWWSATLT
jgi:predicted TIM-barrel enzyme